MRQWNFMLSNKIENDMRLGKKMIKLGKCDGHTGLNTSTR